MLAICIPVYNYDITSLIHSLKQELIKLSAEVSIFIVDDASDEKIKSINELATEGCAYIELKSNIGRAKIRNYFTSLTKAQYLLFLDCDVIIQPDFIKTYIEYISVNKSSSVICGGRIYPEKLPNKNQALSYNYGVKRESKTAVERNKTPNDAFMTNNFVIKRETLENHPFNGSITRYGHEDTLLGYDLKNAGILINHIENPVINGDIESNIDYLQKSEIALSNLVSSINIQENRDDFIKSVRILDVYFNRLNSVFRFGIRIVFKLFKNQISNALKDGNTSLFLFDFYKLGILDEQLTSSKTL